MRISSDQRILLMADPVTQKPIFSIELEPELISGIFQGAWEQRRLIRLSQIPTAMIDAILAAEDHRFYEHHGIDLVRIAKAAWVDLVSGRVRQGGSTLTQQLMKNFFLTQKRDWHRKVKEILMAYIAERRYSKEEILENYVNDIYLGQHGQEGIYGIWEAAQFYFSKEPRDLTIARDGDYRRDDQLAQPHQSGAPSRVRPGQTQRGARPDARRRLHQQGRATTSRSPSRCARVKSSPKTTTRRSSSTTSNMNWPSVIRPRC